MDLVSFPGSPHTWILQTVESCGRGLETSYNGSWFRGISPPWKIPSLVPRLPCSGTWTLKLCRRGEPGISREKCQR